MIRNFFVGSALPPLTLGEMPELSFVDLMALLESNLSKRELEQVRLLRLSIDIENVRRYLLSESIDTRGVFSEKEIDEAILNEVNLPEFLHDFLLKYKGDDRNTYFGSVLASFYREMKRQGKGFVSEYFAFEHDFRLVLTAARAKKHGLDIQRELQFEDPKDPLVAELLAGRDAPKFVFPYEFADLEKIFIETDDDPMKQYFEMVKYRYNWIVNYSGKPFFALDTILGYVMRHLLIEDVASLDSEEGWHRIREAVA